MKAVHNERVKLSATFLNGIAIAVFIIGTFTPAVQIARSASTVGLTPAVATGAIASLAPSAYISPRERSSGD